MLSCGWLGEALAVAAAAEGHRVRGATADPAKAERLRAAGVAPHRLRLTPEPDAPGGETEGFFAVDRLLLAVPPSPFDDYPAAVAAAARAAAAAGCGGVIFTSSTSVYADRPAAARDLPVDEDDDRPPGGARGRRMRAAERALRDAFPGATVARLGGLWGPGREPGRFLAGRRGVAAPDAPVNLLHRDDAVGALLALCAQPAPGESFNVVAPGHPARGDFYRAAALAAGLEPPVFDPAPPGGSPGKRIDAARLTERTGYRFRRPTRVPDPPPR